MTGDSLTYKYLDSNTPKEKINYSYSKYDGELFMTAYLDSRKKVMPPVLSEDALSINVDTSIQTELLFNDWIQNCIDGKSINKEDLNLLIKRFEVTKKLFDDYDVNFRPIDKTKFNSFRLYVLFAYILSLSYSRNNHLQYLNALLKINDINISNIDSIDLESKQILFRCIKSEMTFVSELRNKL